MVTWITKDGRRIPLNSQGSSAIRASIETQLSTFLNPNAHCPNCHKTVAYYQNSYGSKVYFNQVGWPWEKHDCMNLQNSDKEDKKTRITGYIVQLSNGETLEVLRNGGVLGYYDDANPVNSFLLLRLKSYQGKVTYVECPTEENQVFWDTVYNAKLFFRRKVSAESSAPEDRYALWFFAESLNSPTVLREIQVHRTSIPFADCVRAFRH
jgi:hypothetical protein